MSTDWFGVVYLVAVAPQGMTTRRAAELLADAGAVVYGQDLEPSLLAGCASGAERIVLGEEEVGDVAARRLLAVARRHSIVVRVYADYPLALAEGVREIEGLARLGVAFEVVPAVLMPVALAGQAGIPLLADGEPGVLALLLPGTGVPDRATMATLLSHTSPAGGCLVSTTSSGLRPVLDSMVAAGWTPDTAASIVRSRPGRLPQETTGTLGSLASTEASADGSERTVVVAGAPVRQRRRIESLDTRPLRGKRVVVTRPREQAAGFVAELERLGADVLQVPTIRIESHPDREPLRVAAREVGRFDWVVFTSTNGVEHFWSAFREVGRDTRALAGVSVCAIGPATGAALEARGVVPDLIPERFVAESVIEALAHAAELRGLRVLLPRAEIARAVLPDQLRARGAEVVEVAAYRTVPDSSEAETLRNALRNGAVDVITFTASSTVHSFMDLVGADVGAARVATIGPVTSATARDHGLPVHIEASDYTIPGLLRAIVSHYVGG